MEKKKLILVIFGIILLGLLAFGVYQIIFKKKVPVLPKGEEVTLTYWGLWEPSPVINAVIASFEKDHPGIKVDYKMQSSQDYKARLQNALASGQGPDIFRLHQTWVPIMQKQLAPVPDTLSQTLGLENNYFPVISKAISRSGRYYALPLEIDTLALYYNKDLLAVAGGQLPRTWWGLQQLAKQITQKTADGRIITAGVALGTTNNVDHFSDIIGLMLLQNDADPAEPNALTLDVLQYYLLFANKEGVWDKTLPSSTLQFASGKLGFYFAPSWRYFEIKKANPGLNFGIAPVPQLPESREIDWEAAEAGEGELTNITWASFWVEGVSAVSKNQEAAFEFLGYLASAEGLRQFYQAASQTRDFGEIYPLTNLANELTTIPYLAAFVQQAPMADYWYLCSETHDSSLNDLMIKYYEDSLNALSGTGSNDEAVLETLQSGISQVLSQYQL
ncbi:MAG: extracellular solute-binding protein [Candidatus Shapirobacteria bacterium]